MSEATNLRPVDVRKDADSLGEIAVPSTALWGAQTQRSLGRNHAEKLGVMRLGVGLILFVASMALPLSVSAQNFSVPDDVALRIRLDDTLTSVDSQVVTHSVQLSLTRANTRTPEYMVTSLKSTCPAKSRAIQA
jgi:hypothetical protein